MQSELQELQEPEGTREITFTRRVDPLQTVWQEVLQQVQLEHSHGRQTSPGGPRQLRCRLNFLSIQVRCSALIEKSAATAV